MPRKKIEEFASKFKKLYVVEELEPIFETIIKSWGVKVIGKEKLPAIGELDVSTIRGWKALSAPLSPGYQLLAYRCSADVITGGLLCSEIEAGCPEISGATLAAFLRFHRAASIA